MRHLVFLISTLWIGLHAQSFDKLSTSFHFTVNNAIFATSSETQVSLLYGLKYDFGRFVPGFRYSAFEIEYLDLTIFESSVYRNDVSVDMYELELGYKLIHKEKFSLLTSAVFAYLHEFGRAITKLELDPSIRTVYHLDKKSSLMFGLSAELHFKLHKSVSLFNVLRFGIIPEGNPVYETSKIGFIQFGMGLSLYPTLFIKSCREKFQS